MNTARIRRGFPQTWVPWIAAGILLSGCARMPSRGMEALPTSLSEICKANSVSLQFDSVTQVVTLNKNNVTAKVLVGSDVVLIDSEKILLSGPVRRMKEGLFVPPDFGRKVMERFGARDDFAIKKFREIVIDPGHGGKDPGARGRSGLDEKIVVLDIAKRLKRSLEDKGINVIMTRNSDEFLSLKQRTEIACRSKADLFISIHANSSRAKNAEGFEVYFLRELDSKEKKNDELKDNQRIKFRNLAMSRSAPAVENIVWDMMYSYKQGESRRLAEYLMLRTPNSLDAANRGSKSCAFFVLRNTLIPAILVEVGFVSNVKEERLLKTGTYRERIANSLAKHILDYANKD